MSLPSNTDNGQSSIRSFFRPRQPIYAAPPPDSNKENKKTHDCSSAAAPPLLPTTITVSTTAATPTAQFTAPVPTGPPPPPSSRPANLHAQASIEYVKPEHISALRRITSLLLPVNYPDSFYARLSDPLSSGAFSRVILWHDDKDNNNNPAAAAKVIGGLVCRPEPSPFHAGAVDDDPNATVLPPQPNALYIQSLVLLSPYRGLGLAAALLEEVVADAARSDFACDSVWAHVWTENDEAMRWYLARGFARVDEVKNYYHKLQPDSAWIVRREIGPSTVLGLGRNGRNPGIYESASAPVPSSNSVTAAVANLTPAGPPRNPSPSPSSSPNNLPPPPRSPSLLPTTTTRPPATRGQSFQNKRPETEWNDLPADMQVTKSGNGNLSVAGGGGGGDGASSRSSSRKKRERAYPAAAFGN
ncbi:acyl-CoA N-acyltransferase [Xylaria nigripes]|nr:acyl-CoA N-acyltransferase [Xylaria nigripes]